MFEPLLDPFLFALIHKSSHPSRFILRFKVRSLVEFLVAAAEGRERLATLRLRWKPPKPPRSPCRAALRSTPAWPRLGASLEAAGRRAPFSGASRRRYRGPGPTVTPGCREARCDAAPFAGDRARR